jgi:hypothetical protein
LTKNAPFGRLHDDLSAPADGRRTKSANSCETGERRTQPERAGTNLARLLIDRGATNDAAILPAEVFKKIDGGSETPDLVLPTTMLRELGATL